MQARTVFFMSIVMVIGPTPPGTGVMALALLRRFLEGHVSLEDSFAIGGFSHLIYSHVDHHGSRLYPVALDIFRDPGGNDQDVRAQAVLP